MVHIVPEIVKQGFQRSKKVWDFFIAYMLVITLARLIVVSQHTTVLHGLYPS
jgi:hypothetical protein